MYVENLKDFRNQLLDLIVNLACLAYKLSWISFLFIIKKNNMYIKYLGINLMKNVHK